MCCNIYMYQLAGIRDDEIMGGSRVLKLADSRILTDFFTSEDRSHGIKMT